MRSVVKVKIVDKEKDRKLTVVSTHLDHKLEETRLYQLEKLEPFIEDADVLVGDFNSLNRDDYTEERISDINSVRKADRWEECRFDLLNRVSELGWSVPKSSGSTCRFGTRIDYIFSRTAVEVETHDAMTCKLTDHNLVTADLSKQMFPGHPDASGHSSPSDADLCVDKLSK